MHNSFYIIVHTKSDRIIGIRAWNQIYTSCISRHSPKPWEKVNGNMAKEGEEEILLELCQEEKDSSDTMKIAGREYRMDKDKNNSPSAGS